MTTVPPAEAAIPPEDPALRFIRLELAPSPQRWIAALDSTGLALIGVLATVTFRIPYPVLIFAGILLLTVPPTHRPFRQAVEATGAAFLGAGFAILLAVTTYDQPWLYLPLQCAALTALLVLSRITAARAAFILAALVVSFAEPAYLPDPEAAIDAALFNALALAGTAWVVAAAQAPFAPPATRDDGTGASQARRIGGLCDACADRDRPADAVLQHDQSARDPHRSRSPSCSPPTRICGRSGGGCRCASFAVRVAPRSPC